MSAEPLTLTANNRLARLLRAEFDNAQRAAGRHAWPSAAILPWSAWLARQWSELALAGGDRPLLLTAAQESWLWRQIVADTAGAAAWLSRAATAAEAQRAWEALHDYRLAIPPDDWQRDADPAAFFAWQEQFRRRCRQSGWLSAAELPAACAAALATGQIAAPPRLALAGFFAPTPAQSALFAALAAAGAEVAMLPAPIAPELRGAVAAGFADAEEEMRAAARWAGRAVAAGEGGRIGIVVPDLEARRAALGRLFADELEPAAVLPGAAAPSVCNISLAPPLAARPIVGTALHLLRLACEDVPFAVVSALLRSPYCGAYAAEWAARATLETQLRGGNEPGISISSLLWRAERNGASPALARALRRLRVQVEKQPARQSAARWAEVFAACLAEAGWPGDRPLDSAEYQAVAAWRDLVADFARLDLVAPPLTAAAALAELERLAAAQLFQPESPATQIQILGLFETAGLEFARLWVMGLDLEHWPPPARPLAFLPRRAQAEAGLPFASPPTALAFARREQTRLLAAARQAVLSYARQDEERELAPSPLLAELPAPAAGSLPGDDASFARRLVAAAPLDAFADDQGPAADPARDFGGGVRLLADQAACPFRAFAHHRLRAAELDAAPGLALTASQRGDLVHRCLALQAQARRAGLALAADELAAAAVAEWARRYPILRRPAFAAAERRRLAALLAAWDAFEADRPPFAILEIEQSLALEIAGLRLSVRMDRMDRASDGRMLLLDFKHTAKSPSVNAWSGARPDEPQIPLYAALSEPPPAAAAFVQIHASELRPIGWSDAPPLLGGLHAAPLGWPEQLRQWRAALEALAREFLAGQARVDPKYNGKVCERCGVAPLCRIAQFAVAADEGEEET